MSNTLGETVCILLDLSMLHLPSMRFMGRHSFWTHI